MRDNTRRGRNVNEPQRANIASDIGPFAIVPVALLADETVDARALRAWITVASFADRATGEAYPTQDALADRMRCSVDTVQRGLATLHRAGWLDITPRLMKGRKVGNDYVVRFTHGSRTSAVFVEPTEAADSHATDTAPVAASSEQTNEQTIRDNPPTPRDLADDAFAAFWKHYPRKIAKQTARRAWTARARAGIDPELLVRSAERYAQVCELRETGTQFIMHPATFLGPNERWLDYPPISDGERALETGFFPAHLTNARPEDFAVGGC